MSDRLPPLPSLRALTAELRALNEAYSHPAAGGEYVKLYCMAPDFPLPAHWRISSNVDTIPESLLLAVVAHQEFVPGDCVDGEDVQRVRIDGVGVREVVFPARVSSWDAVGAARRLLSAARDALVK